MVFLKEIFEKVDFEKLSRRQKACKITQHAKSKWRTVNRKGALGSNISRPSQRVELWGLI